MTKVFYNGSIANFRGRIGNLIFRQLPDGTTVVSEAPPKETGRRKKRAKEKRSLRQKAHNESVQEAAAYWHGKGKDNPIYAELAAAAIMRTAYNFFISDWFHPPVIQRVEKQEDHILVEATDNIMVARVKVTVFDQEGKVLEAGEAVKGDGDCWEFTPQAQGSQIQAEAWDLAGHKATYRSD
jgi:hypothetical protein